MTRSAILLTALAGLLLAPAAGMAISASQAQPPMVRVAGVAIEVPWTVDPGQQIEVTIPGAVAGGRLEIWGPVTQGGRGRLLAGGEVTGHSVPVTAPVIPGSYELRYLGPSGSMLARRDFEVAAVPIRLWVPERLSSGVPGEIRWRGPARPGDMIQIADPATGAVVAEAPAEGAAGAENVTMIQAPAEAGQYHLRYVSRERGSVLRVLPITVGPSHAWLGLPPHVLTGQSFQVQWHGPVEPGQVFEIVDPTRNVVVVSAPAEIIRGGASAMLQAPDRTGVYRVRVVDTQSGRVRMDLPLTVD